MNKNNIKDLKPGQYWLLEHIITSFWHKFGLSGSDQVMQDKLKNWISNLENYAEKWDNYEDQDHHPRDYNHFIEREKSHESRADILKMLKLIYKMQ